MLVSCSSTSREMGNKPESLRLPWGGGYVSELLINFSRNGEQARIPPITMNGEQIERTDSAKILGSPSQRI